MGKDYGGRGVVEKLDVDEIDSKRTTRHLIRNLNREEARRQVGCEVKVLLN